MSARLLVRWVIRFTTWNALSKEIQIYFISGIYSGIFAVHLQCHASKARAGDNKKQKMTFYALCLLYVLSTAAFALEIALVWFGLFVSINGFLTLRWSVVQSDDIILALRINAFVAPAVFGCCDFIAQFILVRTSDKSFSFSSFI